MQHESTLKESIPLNSQHKFIGMKENKIMEEVRFSQYERFLVGENGAFIQRR